MTITTDHPFVQGIASRLCQHRLDGWNSCLRSQADHGYEIPPDRPVENIYPHPFQAEASTIGLRPGFWPEVIVYEGVPFRKLRELVAAGDLYAVEYRQSEGRILKIWND